MTNYDRKVLARESAQKRAKRKSILGTLAAIAIVACLVALIVAVPIVNKKKVFKEYFKINNTSVSELEFNFHKTNLINSNATFLQYMGITSLEDLDTVVYDESTGATWNDFFEERAAYSIKENMALVDDAKAKNISLDVDTEYDTYMGQVAAEAETAGVDTDTYLTALYGSTEKNLKNIIRNNLTAILYSEYLSEINSSTDEAAQAEYDANKDDYDSVDYRILEFATEVAEDYSEEDIAAAMKETKARAQEMLDKVNAGEDFETLCATYAAEEYRDNYADSETDYSLVTGTTSLYASDMFAEWLFAADRKEGDTYLYEDEEGYVYYVLRFEKRYMGDDVLDNIKQNLTYNTVDEYISTISESYVISDPEGNLPSM